MTEIAPLQFMGGVAADYEIFTASNGALMTRHIASGAVRLSVRMVEPLKSAEVLYRLPGAFPASAQVLSKLPERFVGRLPSKVPGGPKAVAAFAAVTVLGAPDMQATRPGEDARRTSGWVSGTRSVGAGASRTTNFAPRTTCMSNSTPAGRVCRRRGTRS